MFRILLGVSIIGVCGLGLALCSQAESCDNNWLEDWHTLESRQTALDIALANHRAFHEELAKILDAMVYEELPLVDAIQQIEQAARRLNPAYLRNLYLGYNCATLKEQIARNVADSFTKGCRSTAAINNVIQRVNADLAKMFPGKKQS